MEIDGGGEWQAEVSGRRLRLVCFSRNAGWPCATPRCKGMSCQPAQYPPAIMTFRFAAWHHGQLSICWLLTEACNSSCCRLKQCTHDRLLQQTTPIHKLNTGMVQCRRKAIDTHPHLGVPCAYIHPCRHAAVMKKIIQKQIEVGKTPRVDQYPLCLSSKLNPSFDG